MLLFWDCTTQLKTGAMKTFRSPEGTLNQSSDFQSFCSGLKLLSGWSKVADFPTLGSLQFFSKEANRFVFFLCVGFPGST